MLPLETTTWEPCCYMCGSRHLAFIRWNGRLVCRECLDELLGRALRAAMAEPMASRRN